MARRTLAAGAAAALGGCGGEPTSPGAGDLPVAFIESTAGVPGRRLVLGAAGGGMDRRPLAPDSTLFVPQELRWSPNGGQLAALRGASGATSIAVVDAGTGAVFATGLYSGDWRSSMRGFDWAPSGRALVATTSRYDTHVPPGCASVHTVVTVAATPGATPREVYRSAGCTPSLAGAGAVRWGTGGRLLVVTPSGVPGATAPGLSRVVAIDSATGQLQVLRDSIRGAVQDVARSGAWALVLRDRVEDTQYKTHVITADDYRQLVRVDLATGNATVLADRTRLPIPLLTPGDGRVPNDRLRWARLTADDRHIVLALNVEQGQVFGTRLVYRALTPEGEDAGELPGDPVMPPGSVDLRP